MQPLAAVLRHAAAFPPLPHLLAGAPRDTLASDHVARCLQPVELLCQLEGSGGGQGGGARLVERWAGLLEAQAPFHESILQGLERLCRELVENALCGRQHQLTTWAQGLPLPPLPTSLPRFAGKWPDHPEAFQKMKAAVGCQLAQLMHQTLGMDAQVGPRASAASSAGQPRKPGTAGAAILCKHRLLPACPVRPLLQAQVPTPPRPHT